MLGIILEIMEDGSLLAYCAHPAQVVVFRGTEAELVTSDFLINLGLAKLQKALQIVVAGQKESNDVAKVV